MNAEPRCPQCGNPLTSDAPRGLCPKCLLQAGFESAVAPQPSGSGDPAVQPTAKSPVASGPRFEPPSLEELAPLFPQLEILELVGKGGMGAVYKARQKGLDRLVAIKILPPEIGHDPAFAERFTREARALARLNHSNIVSVYDFGQVRNLFYIMMEFVEGANLRQAIQVGGLTPQAALAIVPQICEALQFAHDEGIVHRDIKPENILIDKRGRVKIADFGLAKLLGPDAREHSLTGTHQVMGTMRYMAPEQMQGSREVDHRADIYSLGVVFYELLTRELPMGKFAPPSRKVQIDVRLDDVVLRALEQDPAQRYQHASDIQSDMHTISSDGKTQFPAKHSKSPATSAVNGHSLADETRAINQIGWISVWAAILGVVLPGLSLVSLVFLSSIFHISDSLVILTLLLGAALELVAVGCGIVGRRSKAGRAGLITGSASLVLGLLIVLLVTPSQDEATIAEHESVTSTHPAAPVPDITPATDEANPDGWIMGPTGPQLTESFARQVLQLRPEQVADVNRVLQVIHKEYTDVEAQNTEQHFDERRHLLTTVKPFPPQLAKLEDRLWSQLDAILHSQQQQSIARLNLRLHPKPIQAPIAMSEIVAPKLFGWGNDGAQIEIWKVGTWFHWSISSRGYTDTRSATELPLEYRRFWKEPPVPESVEPSKT